MKLNLKQKQKNPLRSDLFIVIPFTQIFDCKSVLPYNYS